MPATLWTIRITVVLYVLATAAWLTRRDSMARAAWIIGCAFYLAHVAAAFRLVHQWSHDAAYRQTARQTGELFGLNWGGGLYFNYFFTLLWIIDAAWWWRGLPQYRARPRAVTIAIQAFFAFMFFNATVVFAKGPIRWLGIMAGLGLSCLCYLAFSNRAGDRDSSRHS
jgi:hypothetical protein